MVIALSGKNKLGFVDGSLPRPTQSTVARAWDRVNNVGMGWIIVVLEDSIAKSILSYKTAREIWNELNERYGQSSNAQLYSLQEELNNLVQTPNMKISKFFTKIKTLWDELDSLNPLPICSCAAASSCTCEIAKKCNKVQQNNRVISFLMRLDKKFGQVRSNMLMMTELPTSAQAYRILLQEETHLDLSTTETSEPIACRVEKRKFQERGPNKNSTEFNKNKRQHLYCDHCKITGHSKDRCWKIIGYPPNFKGNTWKRGNDKFSANLAQEASTKDGMVTAKLTSTQYQHLLEFLNKQTNSGNNTHANTSQLTSTYCFSSLKMHDWIIDSGASDHMCHLLSIFSSYEQIANKEHVITVPDGRKIGVKYMGTVKLHNGLVLHNVLYVPDFKFNLIAVNKLIADSKCSVSFNNDGCFIQEALRKKSWLLGKSKNGLYILQDEGIKLSRAHSVNKLHIEDSNTDLISATVLSDSLVNKAKL